MKNINIINRLFILGAISFPYLVLAADFKSFLKQITDQLNLLPAFFVGLAVLFLMYNILGYIQSGDPKKKDDARNMITYSIIFIFVMISVWGLVGILVGSFQLGTGASLQAPAIPTIN